MIRSRIRAVPKVSDQSGSDAISERLQYNYVETARRAALIARTEESMKKALLALVASGFLMMNAALAQDAMPKTVIHVITVKWKSDASQAQIDKALQAVAALPSKYSGIKHVWTKPIKKQIPEGYSTVIVMEFADESALEKYADSPAQKSFYDAYMPVREESRTSDITN